MTRRALVQVEECEASFPRLRTSPYLDEWDDREIDRLVSTFQDRPCPALQPDHTCGIYEWRPVTCRLMGPPVEEAGLVQGACGVQTFVPILRTPDYLREECIRLAEEEAGAIDVWHRLTGTTGEEVLLPYGFVSDRGHR